MKKPLIFIVIFVLIGLALIGPKFAGDKFNQGLDNYITAVNNTGVYQARIVSKEQSWFFTNADIQVVLNIPGISDNPDMPKWEVNLQTQAQHGPVLTANGFGIGWLSWAVTLIHDELPATLIINEDIPIYQALGKMSLFGSTSYNDRIASMSYTDPTNGLRASIDGWQGSGKLSNSASEYSGKLSSMSMEMPNIYNLKLNGLSAAIDAQASIGQLIEGQFYNGISTFSFESLEMLNSLKSTTTKMENLVVTTNMDFDKNTDLADITMDTTLAHINSPEITLNDMVMIVDIKNMQQAFFEAYQQMNKDIMQSPERAQSIMQEAMQTYLLGQLQAKPELNISKLNGTINGGNVSATSSNKLVGVTSLPDTMENNDFWLQHIHSSTLLNIDENAATFIAGMVIRAQLAANPQIAQMDPAQVEQLIIQQSELTLNGLLQQGLITKTEETYQMSFNLIDGEANLNGNVIPLLQ